MWSARFRRRKQALGGFIRSLLWLESSCLGATLGVSTFHPMLLGVVARASVYSPPSLAPETEWAHEARWWLDSTKRVP